MYASLYVAQPSKNVTQSPYYTQRRTQTIKATWKNARENKVKLRRTIVLLSEGSFHLVSIGAREIGTLDWETCVFTVSDAILSGPNRHNKNCSKLIRKVKSSMPSNLWAIEVLSIQCFFSIEGFADQMWRT